jgi:polar amino acid transport system substrate-binding protein
MLRKKRRPAMHTIPTNTSHWPRRRASLLFCGSLGLLLGACSGLPATPAVGSSHAGETRAANAQERAALAPTGRLRVGVYSGSPSSYVAGAPGQPARGVGYLLGQAFAEKLGVPFEPVVFPGNAPLLAAAAQGQVDIVFTNATAERARSLDFSPAMLDVQKSVLVPVASPLASLDALRGRPTRIGVSTGSSTGAELVAVFPEARLQPVPTLQEAASLLSAGQLEGFATNNAILFELADRVPGSRVLPGAWGLEHFALGIPKGRTDGRNFVAAFAREATSSGLMRRAVDESRLRGTVAP